MTLAVAARALAETLVGPLGRRWEHVQGVANRAGELAALSPVIAATRWWRLPGSTTSVMRQRSAIRGFTLWTVPVTCVTTGGPARS
ncbi:hypothetical protein [Prauserella aidingensis]|uniref:hypothetical protein n=1 Tax=Prauserella aidingensis TaxID=387890 RepID=UPI0027E251C5|nr:hypothetical protein [Prauserella aidingensis]